MHVLPAGEARESTGRPAARALSRLRLESSTQRLRDRPVLTGLVAGAISGFATSLAFPPADLGLLAYIALVPLALFLPGARAGPTAVAGAAFGLAFFGSLLYWIRLFGNLAYVSLTVVQTLWVIAALLLSRVLRGRLPAGARYAALPLALLAGEFARTHLPWGGFAWGGLGYTQHDNLTALRLAPYGGVWLLSLVILAVNSLIAEAILYRRERVKSAKRLVAVTIVLLLPALLPVSSPTGGRAKFALVQGNVPGDTLDPNADDRVVLDNHVELTGRLDTSDLSLVVWPEGAFDRDPFRDPEFLDALQGSIRKARTPFLVGAIRGSPREGLRNSVVFFDEDAKPAGEYVKQRLVPFGEFVPLRSLLQPMVSQLDRVPYDLVPGEARTVFTLPEGRFAAAICYESTYPDLVRAFVRRGARLLVVSTNFSSYQRTAAADQHIAFSQLRAAEHRMWVAHAALSGKSAVVAPNGEVVETTDLFTRDVLTPMLRFAETTTFYGRLGDWVPFAAVGLIVMLIAVGPLSRRLSEEKRLALGQEPTGDEPLPTVDRVEAQDMMLAVRHPDGAEIEPPSGAEGDQLPPSGEGRLVVAPPPEDAPLSPISVDDQGVEVPSEQPKPALRLVEDDEAE